MRHRVLTAFFHGRSQADGALERLAALGVVRDDISLIPKVVNRRDDIGLATGSKLLEGAALGALAGGAIGALAAALAAGGSLIVPGLDLVVAGAWVAASAGAGAGGAAGAVVGAILGARTPEIEARYLDDAIAMGGSLVAVRCAPHHLALVQRALEACGARHIQTIRAR